MTVKLKNWSCVSSDEPFTAPELTGIRLAGNVFGHHKYKDGEQVTTSRIVAVDGRMITTYSGTLYYLDDIDPKYQAWLVKNGYGFDPHNPIKTRTPINVN